MLTLTDLEKKTCQGIVTIFETSKLAGPSSYSQVTLLRGDTGGLTYGREQTTLMSGNLYLLIQDYVDHQGKYATQFRPFLERMMDCDATLNNDRGLQQLLRDAGSDPIMRSVQDAFFDRVYWMPAATEAERLGFALPLSASVVYDGFIHGSWARIRDRVTASTKDERGWIKAYLLARRQWLANHSNTLLRKCVYRQDAFLALIDAGNWQLSLPLTVRGVTITPQALGLLAAIVPATLDNNDPPAESAKDGSDVRRLLRLKAPPLVGQDVRDVQDALVRAGYPLAADSVYGKTTRDTVLAFQTLRGLKADGVVGAATRAALGII